jgi:hypothetical protein
MSAGNPRLKELLKRTAVISAIISYIGIQLPITRNRAAENPPRQSLIPCSGADEKYITD